MSETPPLAGILAAVVLAFCIGGTVGSSCPGPGKEKRDETVIECVARLEHISRWAWDMTEGLARCSKNLVEIQKGCIPRSTP